MFRVHGDPATNRYNPAGPDPDLAASEEALRDWIERWREDGYGYWAVAVAPATAIVGFGGVRRFSWRGREALNLYYRLAPAVWDHGYATELAQAAVGLARAHLPHLPVIARTRPANLASIRVAERAGLARRPDLDTPEHLVFALGWPPPE
jgi:RimJ/RimL family protein N-acetyltransferase